MSESAAGWPAPRALVDSASPLVRSLLTGPVEATKHEGSHDEGILRGRARRSGAGPAGASGSGRDGDQLHARLEVPGPDRGLHPGQGEGLLRRRGARGLDRQRQRLGRRRDPRRERRLSDGLRRHQRAGRVQRRQPRPEREVRDDGLRRPAVRPLHAQEQRHRAARRPRRPHARRAGVRRLLQAVPGVRRARPGSTPRPWRASTWIPRCARRCWCAARST